MSKDKKFRITSPQKFEGEEVFDIKLRPKRLSDFIGQNKIKENLSVFIEAAKKRHEPLEHILLFGPSGLGKTTLANIIANEMASNIYTTTGSVLERPADLCGILTNLEERDIFFIDEVHRTNKAVEEYLYPALDDFTIDIVLDKGPGARTCRIPIKSFTLIGATTRSGLLTAPLRARFGITFRLDYYTPEDLFLIVKRSAKILEIEISDEGAMEIATRARGTPRIANRLLRRVRDFAQVNNKSIIDKEIAEYALEKLEVDKNGLDEMDKRILLTIIDKFNGGPVGINTLAIAIGESAETLEEVYEPYLVQKGFLNRTLRGREATSLAYEIFGKKTKTQIQLELPNNL
ncbi:MAG: Holliday junction branch migration DNA helicase RuvB [candidate division WOR-3 bacterium]|nr:Holliday junction branch migration DNA helicase RuvB [candidate division WOR-3 bacterium]MCX7757193.1 Holliday junction branch migration DNA helicase RuvB [candidate division WOR-3 bacterium]MDW7987922.1 Holliday junction branch migration DNA helicase RuvB [candidate division WOR-3 bacterium]